MGGLGLQRGIEPLELDARISGGEAPLDGDGLLIATLLPGTHLTLQFLHRCYAAREALASQSRKLDFGHIQPASMQRRMMDFQFGREPTCFGRRKGVVKGRRRMRGEIIHHQDDHIARWGSGYRSLLA